MEFIRPAPPVAYSDSWYTKIGNNVNNQHLRAAGGLKLIRNHGGTTIALNSEMDPAAMNYAGTWNLTQSYAINDVVYVDPLQTYNDQNGNPLPVCSGSAASGQPPLCAGLFVCVRAVPPLGYDSTMLTTYVVPQMTAANQTITPDYADTYRWYDYNCYWPFYPSIPTSSLTTAPTSSYSTTANANFWAPLSPMMVAYSCVNNQQQAMYVSGIMSGSVFNPSQLPYTPPS